MYVRTMGRVGNKVAKTVYLKQTTIDKAKQRVEQGKATGISNYIDKLAESDN